MGRDAVIATLRENTDTIVELHFADGEIQTVNIMLVDDEGVVYELIASNRAPEHPTNAAVWTTFDEIMTVLPAAIGDDCDAQRGR